MTKTKSWYTLSTMVGLFTWKFWPCALVYDFVEWQYKVILLLNFPSQHQKNKTNYHKVHHLVKKVKQRKAGLGQGLHVF